MKSLPIKRKTQRGAVLLVLFLIVFSVAASVFLSSVNTHSVEVARLLDTRSEMGNAKQALISYAINYHQLGFDYVDDATIQDEGPGRLICPDVDNDSLADSTIALCTDYVRGRLPETFITGGSTTVTVTLNDYFSDIDQQFWYVVSPTFKEIATTTVNHLTTGNLTIDGETGYIAVIIAPGEALAGQDRIASNTLASNYLEQGNLAGTDFVNSYPADPDNFNDQVIGIKASELKLEELRINETNNTTPSIFYENARQEFYAYYLANGDLPATPDVITANVQTNLQNTGLGWLIDEGNVPSTFINYVQNVYPYVRYNLAGCTTYWYWFLPEAPYLPTSTYVSGTAC
jgi:hypothetical protein